MSKLVNAGADVGPVELSQVTSSRHEGGGTNLYTIQTTTAVPSGVTLQVEASIDNGNTWSAISGKVLDASTTLETFSISSRAQVKITGLDSNYTGDVNLA